MHRQSRLLALWLGLVLLACRGQAADLAEDQQTLVRSLVQSTAAADQNATQIRLALFDVGAEPGSGMEQRKKELKAILEAESTIACQTVSAVEVQQGILQGFDVVRFPGGNAPKQYALLDEPGRVAVKEFVRGGGGYVGICAGAFLASSQYGAGLELINARPLLHTGPGGKMIPRSGGLGDRVKMDLTDAGRKLFGGPPGEFETIYTSGPIFSPAGIELPAYVSLGTFRSEVWQEESQRGEMVDTPAIVAGRFGDGRVIVFSPHVEGIKGSESLVRRGVLAACRIRSEN